MERGYIKIPVGFVEAIARTRLPGTEIRVLLVIARKTWGWGKQRDRITLSQFAVATGLRKQHILRALRRLTQEGHVTKYGNKQHVTYGISKRYTAAVTTDGNNCATTTTTTDTCVPSLPNTVTLPNMVTSVTKYGNKGVPPAGPTIDTLTKNTYTKETLSLSELLLNLILERQPKLKRPKIEKWAVHIDRMIRIDKRTPEEIKQVIRWCQQDDFWQSNILSTAKLREKFDQLQGRMISEGYSANYNKEVMDERAGRQQLYDEADRRRKERRIKRESGRSVPQPVRT